MYILIFISYFISLLPGFIGTEYFIGYIIDLFLIIVFTILYHKYKLYKTYDNNYKLLNIYSLITIILFICYFINFIIGFIKILNELDIELNFDHIIIITIISSFTSIVESLNAYYIFILYIYMKNNNKIKIKNFTNYNTI